MVNSQQLPLLSLGSLSTWAPSLKASANLVLDEGLGEGYKLGQSRRVVSRQGSMMSRGVMEGNSPYFDVYSVLNGSAELTGWYLHLELHA